MFEIFLFINPTGIYCYDTEKKINDTIERLHIDARFHFVPITSMKIVKDDIIRRRKSEQKTARVSYYTLAANQALEIYHAIKLTNGNKKARQFLFELQKKMNIDSSCFSYELVKEILEGLSLNFDTINALSKTDYVQNSIQLDQKLAEEYQIQKTPTTIIYNEDDDSGVLLEGIVSQDTLDTLLSPSPKKNEAASSNLKDFFTNNNLRLI